MESFDTALRDEQLRESVRRLPGPAYYPVLKWIHGFVKPANYVEIGVNRGVSLHQARRDTRRLICIDPSPDILPVIAEQPPAANAQIYELTSDEFFERHDLTELLLGGRLDLAFIDGLHLFEQVLRDLANLERYADARTVIVLHDCIPFDAATASRHRTTDFYSGDVWKAVLALRRERPDLQMVMIRTAPTGLCLVAGLDPRRRFGEELPEIERRYRDLDFDYYLAHQQQMPEEIPNEVKVIGDWLRAGPLAQS